MAVVLTKSSWCDVLKVALVSLRRRKIKNGLCCRHFGQPVPKTHPHLLKEGQVTPGITEDEYRRRRIALFRNALQQRKSGNPKGMIFIFPSASKVFMSYDIPYTFRQNTEFLYLCGFLEPDSLLLIFNNPNDGHPYADPKSVLFVPPKNPQRELWDGPCSGVEGTLSFTGIDAAYTVDELESFLYEYKKNHSRYTVWYNFNKPVQKKIHDRFLTRFIQESRNCNFEITDKLVQDLRLIKSEDEIELMKNSVEIASESLVKVMEFSQPGMNESMLVAKMDYECRIRGAQYLAYPPVVAGGNRANTVHYVNNNQIVNDGELVLMDAGCELHGYTSDLTRTWPISGTFSKVQKEVYNAVLRCQELCLKMCRKAFSLDDIYTEMLAILGCELKALGLIESSLSGSKLMAAARKFCPHHVGHYLGMDVHDTPIISRRINLEPGMIVTIEPGIYIPETNMMVPAEFRGIGIRIEDNVLITNSSPVILSSNCPKRVEDIEDVMNSKRS
ncbi:xaa-Pro aminopeptidase 3 [Octopus bimaculoides]|uniref:Aminopeptidase P N-terminal domain-containing protein n=1 Tax=Octopus bimaculoides TaxID=37653 RepID=A0A0L8G332_OCTBM|nr:xaa-Pro aminopeptidase 3 [Octopus bimaculoides]|eukprot:XP_014784854.1 PREDICTED: probable Xaa-Pro aminopeptidase 3 [Octopus bimaculoides]